MSKPVVDVSRVESPPMPAVPSSNAHLAPVAPAAVSEGVVTNASPTGLPRIPTEYVPWLLLGATSATSGLAAASVTVESVAAKAVLLGLSAAIGTAAGIISQGYRKPPAP